ncbi:glycosyltransferase family 4 protein [Sphingomonas sp. 1P06PA]|uniref:glycosyltransferase family 4 protein n=1 Tax=Sphingomonas sp. 1P06PA TaxID=554121 RepID=UPI0039A5FCCB
MEAEAALLSAAGHEVAVRLVDNDAIVGSAAKIAAVAKVAGNHARADWIAREVISTRADIVHVHNFFPRLTPAIHGGARGAGAAVVQTLHNYRLFCANALFLRDKRVCEDCLGRTGWPAIRHRCYRGSLPGSAAVVAMQRVSFARGVWHRDVDRFIALTQFAKDKAIAGGLPAGKIAVKPNFLLSGQAPSGPRTGALFVGRLAVEKGAADLIAAWRDVPGKPLTIVGDGPERASLERDAPANVRFLGHQPPDIVRDEMARAACLVVPSIWYEGFPMIVVEALAAGLPIIASRIGSLIEIVGECCGRQFNPGDTADLARKVCMVLGDPDLSRRLSQGARSTYEASYMPASNLAMLERIYADAIASRVTSTGTSG